MLHMLRGELGDARFWRAIRRYVRENAQRNVETIDLIRAIEHSTGRNLRGFFDQWVLRGGHPKLHVAVSYDEKRRVATVTVDQKQRVDDENPAYGFEVDVAFASEGCGTERRIRARIERPHETIAVPLDFEPAIVRFDPGAFILGDVTYAFGAHFAANVLASDCDVVAKIRAARELAEDGSPAARAALRAAFGRDEFWGVLSEIASAAGKTHAPWARDLLIEHSRTCIPKCAARPLLRSEPSRIRRPPPP